MSVDGNLATEERLRWLRTRLQADGNVRIAAAAGELAVSEMTIRRDLQELDAMGLARRVRGGAVAVGPAPYAERQRRSARAKARMAAKLLPLVPARGAIGIDASSTLVRLASQIESARDLVVVTNGLETFAALTGKAGVSAILTGGTVEPRTGSLVGPIACRAAAQFRFARLFVSASGIDSEAGTYEPCLEEAEVKWAMAAAAADVVLAVDSTKLERGDVTVGMDWGRVSTLVTELDPASRRLAAYRDRVRVI